MSRHYDHVARPWRDKSDPDHEPECMKCGDPVVPAGSSWRHDGEDEVKHYNRPLPQHAPTYDATVELGRSVLGNLPPDASDEDRLQAIVDILYWRGALRPRQSTWQRPDRRRAAA